MTRTLIRRTAGHKMIEAIYIAIGLVLIAGVVVGLTMLFGKVRL